MKDFIKEEHLNYLDTLRESGVVNMFWTAGPYLISEYPELSAEEAKEVMSYWMKTFGCREKVGNKRAPDLSEPGLLSVFGV